MKQPGKKARRLIKRVESELGVKLPDDTYVKRTYAGRNQKSIGAFTWFFHSPNDVVHPPMGSSWPVTNLLKCNRLSMIKVFGIDYEILPDDTIEEMKENGLI